METILREFIEDDTYNSQNTCNVIAEYSENDKNSNPVSKKTSISIPVQNPEVDGYQWKCQIEKRIKKIKKILIRTMKYDIKI